MTTAVVFCDNCKRQAKVEVVKKGRLLQVQLPTGWITDIVPGPMTWRENNDDKLKKSLHLDDDPFLAIAPDRHFCSQTCLNEYKSSRNGESGVKHR